MAIENLKNHFILAIIIILFYLTFLTKLRPWKKGLPVTRDNLASGRRVTPRERSWSIVPGDPVITRDEAFGPFAMTCATRALSLSLSSCALPCPTTCHISLQPNSGTSSCKFRTSQERFKKVWSRSFWGCEIYGEKD